MGSQLEIPQVAPLTDITPLMRAAEAVRKGMRVQAVVQELCPLGLQPAVSPELTPCPGGTGEALPLAAGQEASRGPVGQLCAGLEVWSKGFTVGRRGCNVKPTWNPLTRADADRLSVGGSTALALSFGSQLLAPKAPLFMMNAGLIAD